MNTNKNNEGDEELSYSEILAAAILNGEVSIIIPIEDEERVKAGLRNYKSKQAMKDKADGIPQEASVLSFSASFTKDFPGCTDLHVIIKSRGTVKVKAFSIVQQEIF